MGGKKKDNLKFETAQKRKVKENLDDEMAYLLNEQQGIIQHLAKRQKLDRVRQKSKASAIYQKNIDADDKDISFESDEKQARSVMTSSDEDNEVDVT